MTVEELIKDTSMGRPHVVVIGAGASVAALPNGDSNGKTLPVMDNLVEVVGLEPVLERNGIEYEGKNFEAIFEEECQRRGIKLFVLPPRSPKLNGAVERVHRTHTEEFYEVTESSFDLPELREELLEWEQVYNTVRPHQALGYVTPLRFLKQQKQYLGKEGRYH